MKVGIVGLGNMGGRMAKNLIKAGFDVGVFDINEKTLKAFREEGAVPYSKLNDLAKDYPYIITILPNVYIVKDALFGENGLVQGMNESSLIIEMTTSEPSVTEEIHKELSSKQLRMIDAPVSGGVKKAEDGTLTIMVGGEEADVEEVRSLLDKIGKDVIHVGDIGAGHTIKALNNLISATTLAATGEALALGVKKGLNPEKMLKVINTSTGRSLSSEYKFPTQVLTRDFKGGFTLELMVKDLKIALGMAEEEKAPMVVSSSCYQLWKHALSSGKGPEDHTAVIQLIENMIGVEIKS